MNSADHITAQFIANRLSTMMSSSVGESDRTLPVMTQWLAKKHIILEGRPLDFVNRPWLKKLYDDQFKHIVLRKAAQVGGSVWAILQALHKCDEIPDWRSCLYTFPTYSAVVDFSQTRVKPLIDENPELVSLIGNLDKAGAKQIGRGFLFFRGLKSRTGMKSLPADCVVLDELDEASESSKKLIMERLSGSRYGYIYELSNPSQPGIGIDLAFAGNAETGQPGSDERMWMIRCGCKAYTCMEDEFPNDVGHEDLRCLRPEKKHLTTWRRDLLNGIPIEDMGWFRSCVKCGRELDITKGEWVAKKPRIKAKHGYALSQLWSPMVAPYKIVQEYATTRYAQTFYNMKIGIGWVPSSDRLTLSHVIRWCSDAPLLERSETPCTMGVDTGADLHVVISRWSPYERVRQIVYLGVHRDFDELDDLIKRFKVARCVIDANPETREARALATRNKKKVFLNTYVVSYKGRPHWDTDNSTVKENRTESLDASRAPFHLDPTSNLVETNTPRIILPRQFDLVTDFARHMAALVRAREEDDDGNVSFIYKHSAPDHFAHAWNYDCLGWMEEMDSKSRPTSQLAYGTLGAAAIGTIGTTVTNPDHPLYRRKPLLIRQR